MLCAMSRHDRCRVHHRTHPRVINCLIVRWLQRFDCNSTALWPIDEYTCILFGWTADPDVKIASFASAYTSLLYWHHWFHRTNIFSSSRSLSATSAHGVQLVSTKMQLFWSGNAHGHTFMQTHRRGGCKPHWLKLTHPDVEKSIKLLPPDVIF